MNGSDLETDVSLELIIELYDDRSTCLVVVEGCYDGEPGRTDEMQNCSASGKKVTASLTQLDAKGNLHKSSAELTCWPYLFLIFPSI